MSFKIFTDTSSNLPTPLLNENQIGVIPLEYIIDGKAHTCLDTEAFDGERYFDAIRSGTVVTTSQITPQHYVCRHVVWHQRFACLCRGCGKARL